MCLRGLHPPKKRVVSFSVLAREFSLTVLRYVLINFYGGPQVCFRSNCRTASDNFCRSCACERGTKDFIGEEVIGKISPRIFGAGFLNKCEVTTLVLVGDCEGAQYFFAYALYFYMASDPRIRYSDVVFHVSDLLIDVNLDPASLTFYKRCCQI